LSSLVGTDSHSLVVADPQIGQCTIIPVMNESELIAQLERESFSHTYVWEDGPNARYPDHAHRTETAHIILSGEMTLIMNGESNTYHAGDRCDVPANAVHAAIMGPRGCRYLVGER
jgi:quercetin dioxygenase-like cupin family protein